MDADQDRIYAGAQQAAALGWRAAHMAELCIPIARRTLIKVASAIGGPLLAVAFATPGSASTSTDVTVPCTGSSGGAAGLVAAIDAANASGGGKIHLVQGCTYTLTAVNNINPSFGDANGLPVVRTKVTIDGSDGNNQQLGDSDSSGATIAGNGVNLRVLEVDAPGGDLTLQDVTITQGVANAGGGLLNLEGSLTLNHCRVTGNVAFGAGGGIASGTGRPGPIGTTTINHSQVNGNTAISVGGHGGGGGILNHAGTMTINHSQVNNNVTGGGGGGIATGPGNGGAEGSSTLIVMFSQVNNNVSTGGAMAGAGGIANGGLAHISHSQVNNNSAPGAPGGGILNHGTMTIDQSQISGNQALTDAGGHPGLGGGIANVSFTSLINKPSGVLTLNHVEVSGNTASGPGGGILEVGVAPDFTFTQPGGALALNHSKITGNTALSGGGIFATPLSPITASHTRINGNAPNNCFPPGSVPGCTA